MCSAALPLRSYTPSGLWQLGKVAGRERVRAAVAPAAAVAARGLLKLPAAQTPRLVSRPVAPRLAAAEMRRLCAARMRLTADVGAAHRGPGRSGSRAAPGGRRTRPPIRARRTAACPRPRRARRLRAPAPRRPDTRTGMSGNSNWSMHARASLRCHVARIVQRRHVVAAADAVELRVARRSMASRAASRRMLPVWPDARRWPDCPDR